MHCRYSQRRWRKSWVQVQRIHCTRSLTNARLVLETGVWRGGWSSRCKTGKRSRLGWTRLISLSPILPSKTSSKTNWNSYPTSTDFILCFTRWLLGRKWGAMFRIWLRFTEWLNLYWSWSTTWMIEGFRILSWRKYSNRSRRMCWYSARSSKWLRRESIWVDPGTMNSMLDRRLVITQQSLQSIMKQKQSIESDINKEVFKVSKHLGLEVEKVPSNTHKFVL